jgi:hypothetical protein
MNEHAEHDLKLAEAIAAHPAVGKLGDGHWIAVIQKLLPIIIQLINQFGGGGANPPAPTPAPPAGN